MFKLLSPQQIAILAAIIVGAFALGGTSGFMAGWTTQGWRKDTVIEGARADRAESAIEAINSRDKQFADQKTKIGDLNEKLTKARRDLAAANRDRPRVDTLSLCDEGAGDVPAGQGAAAAGQPPGSVAGADAVAGTHGGTRTVETAGIYSLTDRGDQCLIDLKGWREYAREIGAIQ